MSARPHISPRPRLRLPISHWVVLATLVVALFALSQPARAGSGTFIDDDGSTHEADIEAIAHSGITQGCGYRLFCPKRPVTRGEFAAFLHRALKDKIPTGTPTRFTDTSTSIFTADIDWLSATGITRGCSATRFCPSDPVTRGQIAAFLRRAFEGRIPAGTPTNFSDTASSTFRADIAWLSSTGVTRGCSSTRFCPRDSVTREQLASFLVRALGLDPIPPGDVIYEPDRTPSGPVTISNRSGATIEGLSISNPNGPCIRVIGSSNVTIENSTIGPCGDWGVFIDRSSGVTVRNSIIRTESSRGGVYGHSSSGVAVLNNTITNSGRNPIQFDKVTGSGNRIANNSVLNSPAEDMISLYLSSGTPNSWIRVTGNTVRNNTGQSNSGSGILAGDRGGSYILVEGNRLINPGQAGIGVAGGTHIRVIDNRVSSAQFPWSNVGIYVWNQTSSSCNNIEVRGNTVDYISRHGQSNPAYNGGGCGQISGWNQNSW